MHKLNFRNDFLAAIPRTLSKMNKFTILGEEGTSVLAGILSCSDLNLKIWLLWIEKYHGPQRKTLGARGEPTRNSTQTLVGGECSRPD